MRDWDELNEEEKNAVLDYRVRYYLDLLINGDIALINDDSQNLVSSVLEDLDKEVIEFWKAGAILLDEENIMDELTDLASADSTDAFYPDRGEVIIYISDFVDLKKMGLGDKKEEEEDLDELDEFQSEIEESQKDEE